MLFYAFSVLGMVAIGSIKLDRTIDNVHPGFNGSLIFDHGCDTKDQYGSNDCTLNWGETYHVAFQGSIGEDITAGAMFNIEAKVLFKTVNINCAFCGKNCTFTIESKDISIKMPDCPIKAGSEPQTLVNFTLPANDPLPIKVKAEGSGTGTLADGSVLVTGSFEAEVSKLALE
eukprot:TRINITY_DN201_c0_g1_i2.p1 TRINITY_DN201_c0_g1~~TRINITY_DN201_c0_g1_i2.p1  ORF type:complete len:173 (+),score=17.03 TRINITY_DN201_c0_g1_i2:65-583(+)